MDQEQEFTAKSPSVSAAGRLSGGGLVVLTVVDVFRSIFSSRKIKNFFHAEGVKCATITSHQGGRGRLRASNPHQQ